MGIYSLEIYLHNMEIYHFFIHLMVRYLVYYLLIMVIFIIIKVIIIIIIKVIYYINISNNSYMDYNFTTIMVYLYNHNSI